MANGADGSLSQADIDALLSGVEDADITTDEPSSKQMDTGSSSGDSGMEGLDLDGLLSAPVGETKSAPKTTTVSKSKRPKAKYSDLDDSENMELLLDVKMNLSVELGRTKMRVEKVLSLGSGVIIELDKLNGEFVDILVNNRLIARGEVVAVDENFGVKVIEIIDPEERFKIEL